MKTFNRNVLQSDIKNAIAAANEYDSMMDADEKAAFLSGYLRREYPEIATLLRYIAQIEAAPLTGEEKKGE